MTKKFPQLGFVLLASLSFFWGVSWPFMKIALGEIPPWTFRTLCLFLGGIGVLGLARVSGSSLTVPLAERWPLILVALLNITGYLLGSAFGLVYMNAGRAAIIAFTMPVWASILGSLILGERLTAARLLGLFLGIAGLFVLIGPDIGTLGSAPLGAACMLVAAVSWAGGTVALKYFRWAMPTAALAGWQMILGGIPVIAGALIFEPVNAITQVTWRGILAMAYLILVGIIFCYLAWVRVVQLFPANVAALGTLAIPVIGVFSSALILGEPVGIRETVALLLVLMALAIAMLKPNSS